MHPAVASTEAPLFTMKELSFEDRLEMIAKVNQKAKEFLSHATDEDFKRMFENVPKINLDALSNSQAID